jgi:uncharacterized membrane protein
VAAAAGGDDGAVRYEPEDRPSALVTAGVGLRAAIDVGSCVDSGRGGSWRLTTNVLSMRRGVFFTVVALAVGAGIGAAVGGGGGLLLGAVIGFLAGQVGDLRSRLTALEEAQQRREAAPTGPAGSLGTAEGPGRAGPPGVEPSEPSPGTEVAQAPAPETPPRRHDAGEAPPEPPPEPFPRLEKRRVPGPARATVPPEPRSAETSARHEPSAAPLPKLAAALKAWLTTGNSPVKVGALVLLVGVGLLIREAGRRGVLTLTIEVRLIAVAVFAVMLGALGWRQRLRRVIYGRSLQGAAIAVLYLTTYAAFEVYGIVPVAAAAAVVIVVTIGAGALAVTQDARILAVLGIIGGFLAPVLSYSRPEDYVVVFSFYTVLSAAIAGVAWFKTWPSLTLLGYVFNLGTAGFWLFARFSEEDWPRLQPFIAAFVLIYLVLPALFAVKERSRPMGLWTAPLVFGAPFLGLGLQQLVVGHTARGVAVSVLVLAGLHVALHVVVRRLGSSAGDLAAAYAWLAVGLAAIAVPLWLGAYFVAIAWTAQGLMLLWFGCRRTRVSAVVAGSCLGVLAAGTFALHLSDSLPYPGGQLVILNRYFLGAALLATAALVSGALLNRSAFSRRPARAGAWAALGWGIAWWLSGGLVEIANQAPSWKLPLALGFVVASLGAAAAAAERLRWPQLNMPGVLILPTLAVVLGLSITEASHPLGRYGWAAWPLALGVYYGFLRIRDRVLGALLATLHSGGFWVLAALVATEVHWQVGRVAGGVWTEVAAVGAVLVLLGGVLFAVRRPVWPFGPHRRVYVTGAIGPLLIAAAAALFVMMLLLDGDPAPFLYIPVLNPLEMLAVPLLMLAWAWRRDAAAEGEHWLRPLAESRWVLVLAPAGVVMATMSVARTIHWWRDVPWEFRALTRSTELQAALSITWAVIALSTMVVAVRLGRRPMWMAGASFMGLVVAKLFFVDLASLGAVTRVVSFLGVGALLVVVGYFAPVVPAAVEGSEDRTGAERSKTDHDHR